MSCSYRDRDGTRCRAAGVVSVPTGSGSYRESCVEHLREMKPPKPNPGLWTWSWEPRQRRRGRRDDTEAIPGFPEWHFSVRARERARLLRAARDVLDDVKLDFAPLFTRHGTDSWTGYYSYDRNESTKQAGTLQLTRDILAYYARWPEFARYRGGSI